MGYEELIQELVREAEAKAEEILRIAREEEKHLMGDAAERAERMEKRFREDLAREVEQERRVRMNRLRMEVRAILLRARSSLVEEVFKRLEERLRSLRGEKSYPAVAERLCREILPELPEGNITLHADPAALAVLKPLVKDRPVRFEPLPADELGGIEISDEAGNVRIRNTLKARLAKARPRLMVELHRWLPPP